VPLVFVGLLQGMVKTGLVPASLTAMQNEFHMSNTRAGSLASTYDATFFILAFIFCIKNPPLTLFPIALGAVSIGVGSAMFAMAGWEWMLFIAQILLGLGSTPLWILAPCYLEVLLQDPAHVRKAMGAMYSMNPLGIAIGFVLGGMFSDAGNWRVPFIIVAVLMIPAAAALFYASYAEKVAKIELHDVAKVDFRKVLDIYRTLWSNKVFVALTLGSATSGLTLSGCSVFLPKFFEERYHLLKATAALYVGICIIPGAVLGNLVGGLIPSYHKLSLRQELAFSSVTTAIAAACCPLFLIETVGGIIPALIGAMFIGFVSGPLITSIIVSICKTPETKAVGMSISNLAFRIIGTIPGPLIMGAMLDDPSIAFVVPFIFILLIGFGLSAAGFACAWYAAGMHGNSREHSFVHRDRDGTEPDGAEMDFKEMECRESGPVNL
jgi:predicted MFS family arabinose efflux permease